MSPERLLVVRVGAMGDVLHALPAVTALHQRWPDTPIDWVVDPRWAPLLIDEAGRGPVVSQVHLAETKLWSKTPFSGATLRSILRLRQALQAQRYRYVVDVQGTIRSAVIGRMAGGADFTGFADPREKAAAWLYRRRLNRQGTHVVQQNAALLGEALGLRLEPAVPDFPISAASEAWAERTLADLKPNRPIALLAPTAGWGAKQWPTERFAALAQKLNSAGFRALVNGTNAADGVGLDLVRASAGAATLVPCDVAQLISLTRRAAVVVGGDSGPVHLAAALGRPVVALFGPTDPARNGPWGPGPMCVLRDPLSVTSHKKVPGPDPGLARITVQEVLDAVQAMVPCSPGAPPVCENR